MQAQRVGAWFVALYVLLLALGYCDSYQHKRNHKQNHKQNHNKARAKYTTEGADDKPEGKIFGWKRKPTQTNVIFITRPATSSVPLASVTTTAITSPVAPVTATATITTTAVRRPYVQRYGGYRRKPVRQNQGYRRRANQRPWNRRRVWSYGREDEAGDDVESASKGQESENSEKNEIAEGVGDGVNAKLDIEQLEKSLLSQQDTYTHNDAGQIAVAADERKKIHKQQTHQSHLKVKAKKPQTTAIFSPTMPVTTFMPTTDAAAAIDATSNDPTYAEVAVNSNGNTKKDKSGGDKRQTIWQGIRQAWRERRNRQKNTAMQKQKQPQQQQQYEVDLENDDESEHEIAYVATEDEIYIDENGELHIKKRRKNNNNKRQQKPKQPQQQQKKRRKQQESTNKIIKNNENNVISENNTNSRLQNIMNAFRRTPIIFKQNGR